MITKLARGRKLIYTALLLAAIYLVIPATALAGPAPGQVDVCAGGTRCNTFVENYINPAILVLSGLIGIAAVISIIIAGIQYTSSADDPSVVSKAKQRIFNTVLSLVVYLFLFAFVNYLVPGGIM